WAPASTRARVSAPSPAPTSTTWSPARTPAARTTRRIVLGSTTKFCPRARLGRTPWRSKSSSARRRVIVTRLVEQLPADLDLDHAQGGVLQLREGGLVEVDDPAGLVRAPVGDHAGRGRAVLEASDRHDRALRDRD